MEMRPVSGDDPLTSEQAHIITNLVYGLGYGLRGATLMALIDRLIRAALMDGTGLNELTEAKADVVIKWLVNSQN